MCTVTLFRDADGYVFTMNRDERWERGETPPQQWVRDGVMLEYPVDTEAGGTWFGRNDQGVCIALLNNYQASINSHAVTRGKIIPDALVHGSFSDVVAYVLSLDMHQFNAFDLIIAGPERTVHFSWNKELLAKKEIEMLGWYFFTSSSINFPEVYDYRRAYFVEWSKRGVVADVINDVHYWQTDNKSYSICMERPLSHSKSVVQVKYPDKTAILYHPF